MHKTILLPGTFDPITLGHTDLIERALLLFDKVVIGVSTADGKSPMLDLDQRINLIKEIYKNNKQVEIKPMSGLLVNFLKQNDIKFLLRGLRNPMDASYELEMLDMNRSLADSSGFKYETIFLFPGDKVRYISSTRVREIAAHGGDISAFVPALVSKYLQDLFKN